MEDLKADLIVNREKLEELEKKLNVLVDSLHEKKQFFEEEALKVEQSVKDSNNKIVTFNVSGKIFKTKLTTLVNIEHTFFYKISLTPELLNAEVIYLDRNPFYFEVILNFLRFKVIDYNRFNFTEKKLLLLEADYYEVKDISKAISFSFTALEVIKFEFNGSYSYKGKKAGTNRIEDLSDKSLMKGICATSPGIITFTLNKETELTSIEIGGYVGNSEIWNCENGAGASISVSTDKTVWVVVGSVPIGFGTQIKRANITKSKARYLRISSTTSYVGIGYLKVYSDS